MKAARLTKKTRQRVEFLTFTSLQGQTTEMRRSCQNLQRSVQDLTLQTCTADNPAGSQAGDRGYPNQGLFSNPHTPHRCMRTHPCTCRSEGRVNLHQLLLNSNLACLPKCALHCKMHNTHHAFLNRLLRCSAPSSLLLCCSV